MAQPWRADTFDCGVTCEPFCLLPTSETCFGFDRLYVAVQVMWLMSYAAATQGLLFIGRKYSNVGRSNNRFSGPEATELLAWSLVLIFHERHVSCKKKKGTNITSGALQLCLKFRPSQRFHTPTASWLREPPETINRLYHCFVLLNPLTRVKMSSSLQA